MWLVAEVLGGSLAAARVWNVFHTVGSMRKLILVFFSTPIVGRGNNFALPEK
jgi:hypothetical protein